MPTSYQIYQRRACSAPAANNHSGRRQKHQSWRGPSPPASQGQMTEAASSETSHRRFSVNKAHGLVSDETVRLALISGLARRASKHTKEGQRSRDADGSHRPNAFPRRRARKPVDNWRKAWWRAVFRSDVQFSWSSTRLSRPTVLHLPKPRACVSCLSGQAYRDKLSTDPYYKCVIFQNQMLEKRQLGHTSTTYQPASTVTQRICPPPLFSSPLSRSCGGR